MKKQSYKFSNSIVDYYFDGSIGQLKKMADPKRTVIITNEHVFAYHRPKFKGWNTLVLKPGEEYKIQATADTVIDELISMQADRQTMLVGVGGGVITDLTGYIASVYMRGVPFGFVPTTVLSMVDASIGGKNGIDIDVYKNMVGTIRQPSFILYDAGLLKSLPQSEWENGFAEIIKHACIRDAVMFRELEKNSVKHYRLNQSSMQSLIRRNALLKTTIVRKDEFEKNERRLLNFGHTLGHALENQYELSHGQAISIGMVAAAHISEQINGFKETERIARLLDQYNLPTYASFNKKKVMDVLKMDKKRIKKEMNYVLLDKIGKAVVKPIPLHKLEKLIAGL